MADYARMNQYLYGGNAKEVEQRTKDALAEGRSVQEVLTHGQNGGRWSTHQPDVRRPDRRRRVWGECFRRRGPVSAAGAEHGSPAPGVIGLGQAWR